MKPQKITTGPLKVKSAMLTVALGAAIGLSFDLLVRGQQVGLGFVVFASVIVSSFLIVRSPRRLETSVLLAAAWLIGGWAMIRSAEYMAAINICAAALLLSAAASSEVFDPRIIAWRVRDHVSSWFVQLGALAMGATRPIGKLISERTGLKIGGAMPYLRGFVFAAPVFAVFALLLSSADSVFSNLLGDAIPTIDISLGSTGTHLVWIAGFAWIAAGFLVFVVQPERPAAAPVAPVEPGSQPHSAPAFNRPIKRTRERGPRFGYIEAMMVLGSVTALFAVFVIIQFAYLFGGADQIDVPGVTYAEYARAGFFQLLAVAVLTMGLVWISLQAIDGELNDRQRNWFRGVSTLMILLTGVILISALKRLGLYEEAYGFTRMRLLSHAFTFLVGGMLVLMLAQLYRSGQNFFLAGSVCIGFVTLFVLNAINPDAYIAARNLERPIDSRAEEPAYLDRLSADAIPTVLSRISSEPEKNYENWLKGWVCTTLSDPRGGREWNLGYTRATNAARDAGFAVREQGCLDWNGFDPD